MTRGQGEMYEALPFCMRGDKKINTIVVAEIGNNWEGSIGNLIHMIECAALAGADAVKFQCHLAHYESTFDEQFPKRFQYHPQDFSRQEYWERMELTHQAMEDVATTCKHLQLKCIASVFCTTAVEYVFEKIPDIWAIKIPSGETNNQILMEYVWKQNCRVVLSTGMSDTREVNANICLFKKEPEVKELYVLQCTTSYPTLPQAVGMNVAEMYSRNLLFHGGLSDHSGTIFPSIIAAYLGAEMVEVHVTFHKRMFGADITSSITFEELEQLVKGVRFANQMAMNPINKDLYQPEEDAQVYRQGKRR